MATFEVPFYADGDWERVVEARMATARAEDDYRNAERADAMGSSPRRVGDEPQSAILLRAWQEAEEALDQLVDEVSAQATLVRGQSIGRARFKALRLEHPPRTKKVTDGESGQEREVVLEEDRIGVNLDTFPMALLTFRDAEGFRTITTPEKTPVELASWLDDELSEGEVERLWSEAWRVNAGGPPDPKSLRSSAARQTSSVTSE